MAPLLAAFRYLLRIDSPIVAALVTEGKWAMETYSPGVSLLEPAVYRICIQGILDKKWSDYCRGMTIEHESDPKRYAKTILTGRLSDQSALIGVLNWLHDLGCLILAVEYKEARSESC